MTRAHVVRSFYAPSVPMLRAVKEKTGWYHPWFYVGKWLGPPPTLPGILFKRLVKFSKSDYIKQ